MPLASRKTLDDITAAQRELNEAVREWYWASGDIEATAGERRLFAAWERFEEISRRFDAEIGVPEVAEGSDAPFANQDTLEGQPS